MGIEPTTSGLESTWVFNIAFEREWKKKKLLQHGVFVFGHPSRYESRKTGLNFVERTTRGAVHAMTFCTKFLLFVSTCVPPNNPITFSARLRSQAITLFQSGLLIHDLHDLRSKDFFFTSCGSLIPYTRANAQWVIHGLNKHLNLHFRVNSLFHHKERPAWSQVKLSKPCDYMKLFRQFRYAFVSRPFSQIKTSLDTNLQNAF